MELWLALLGVLSSVITIALTNYWAKKNQLKFEERKLKEQYYTTFIQALSYHVVSNHTGKSLDAVADAQNKLLLVGSPEVVKRLMLYHDYAKLPIPRRDEEKHDQLLTDLIKSMRDDLFKSRNSNKNYPLVHLSGKTSSK